MIKDRRTLDCHRFPGLALPHYNELDKDAVVDALTANRCRAKAATAGRNRNLCSPVRTSVDLFRLSRIKETYKRGHALFERSFALPVIELLKPFALAILHMLG